MKFRSFIYLSGIFFNAEAQRRRGAENIKIKDTDIVFATVLQNIFYVKTLRFCAFALKKL